MKKSEFVKRMAQELNVNNKEATDIVNTFLEVLINGTITDGGVSFTGVFSTELKDVEARTCRNPKTGEAIDVPAKKAVRFKVGKKFKDEANK